MRRRPLPILALLAFAGACGDTDVRDRGADAAPGQELGASGAEREVEPVDLEAQPWFQESGTVEFHDRVWLLSGRPVYDPAVEHVGEYQGTPLYAEVNVAPPYRALFIPVDDDYWQMLRPATDAGPGDTTGVMTGIPDAAIPPVDEDGG